MKKVYVISSLVGKFGDGYSEGIDAFELSVNDAIREVEHEEGGEVIDVKMEAHNLNAVGMIYNALIFYSKDN